MKLCTHDRVMTQNRTYEFTRYFFITWLTARRIWGRFSAPEWSESFAWYELCGGI